jgi:hypothetical protein
MVNYAKAFRLPFRNWKLFGIGVLLSLITGASSGGALLFVETARTNILSVISIIVLGIIIVFLTLLVNGYALECARHAIRKSITLPNWKNVGQYVKQGFLGMLIGLIYSLPALIVLLIVVGTAIISSDNVLAMVASIGLGGVILIGLFIITGYITPIAVMRYITTSFVSAFDITAVIQTSWNTQYLVTLLIIVGVSLGLSIALAIIQAILSFAGTSGVLIIYVLTAISTFALKLITFSLYGAVYGEIPH